MPKVSVVMAVHNGMPYLPEAVNSILGQSLRDLEFVIVDDASDDGSVEFLEAVDDERLRLMHNRTQEGLSRSLNRGLEAASGLYVARMDHDDVSLPTRLAEQVAFMDAHPEVDICGTWAKTLGASPEQTWRYPEEDAEIRAEMLFASVLVHGSVMVRRASLERYGLRYDPDVQRAQDYELWVRAAKHLRFANVAKVLLRYRVHPGQVGQEQGAAQQAVAEDVRARQLRELGLNPSAEELALHHALARWDFVEMNLDQAEAWLLKVEKANQMKKRFNVEALRETLEGRWWAACRASIAEGLVAWRRYTRSALSRGAARSGLEKARFYGKCLLREWGLRA